MPKIQLRLDVAQDLAARIVGELAAACERIEVAGSVRRRAEYVGDIEIVAIPRRTPGLFGQPGDSELDPVLARLSEDGRLLPGRCSGPRYKQLGIPGVEGLCLDLFLVSPETWGVQLAIRTGPSAYSKKLVTPQRFGGLLDDELYVHQALVWGPADDVARRTLLRGQGTWKVRATPEERDYLQLCGGYHEPWNRGKPKHRRKRHGSGKDGRPAAGRYEAADPDAG